MKFLVVGFSEQVQKAIEVLLQLESARYSYCSVPRQFTEKYTYDLPNISASQQKCDFCIIDLDGIGLSQYDVQTRGHLLKITSYKPSVLISRQSYDVWSKDVLLSNQCVVLKHTYTRQELINAINKILSFSIISSKISPLVEQDTVYSTTISISANPQEIKFAPLAERAKFSKHVLKERWEDFDKYPIVEQLLDIFSQNSPYFLNISEHCLLVNPHQGTVVLKTLSCIVDYFILMSGFNFESLKINTQSLMSENYNTEKEHLLKNGYKVYSLNLLIWQIFQEIFPSHLSFNDENIRIKIKYMPNFTALRSVSPYMQALAATCVVVSNSFQDLRERFDYLQDEHLHRFFFLVLVADIVDGTLIQPLDTNVINNKVITEVSESGVPALIQNEKPISTPSNDGVEKAKNTGFLARLLKKLSF